LGELGVSRAGVVTIRRAIDGNPLVAWFHGDLGINLERLGRREDKRCSRSKPLRYRNIADAEQWVRRALTLDPAYVGARTELGESLYRQQRYPQGTCRPSRSTCSGAERFERAYHPWDSARRVRELDEAFALAAQGVTLAPDSAAAHAARGEVFLHAERADEALASFERALALDASFAQAHGGRGSALSQLGRPNEAAPALRRALEIDPEIFEKFPEMKLNYRDSLAALESDATDPGLSTHS
jgi:tetratricopeptide (TPR) repeat protein